MTISRSLTATQPPAPAVSRCGAGVLAAMILLAGAVPVCQGSLTIQINAGSGLAGNSAALAAFNRAAAEWSIAIANDVTIYVDADLSSSFSNPNIIGGASFTYYDAGAADINLDYATIVRPALVNHSSITGNAVLNHLPTSLSGMADVPAGATLISDSVGILRANQRVLGLLSAADVRADGVIAFNSAFSFDYDRFDANGVGFGLMDFQTVAAHELGHILGFLSDVDEFDAGYTSTNLTTLDLFRFGATNQPTNFTEFQTLQREMRPGEESVISDTVNAYALATGVSLGDGSQASHWKDDGITGQLIGMMDPNLSTGTFRTVSAADLRALELIGYTLVPEPGRAGLMLIGVCCMILRRRRC